MKYRILVVIIGCLLAIALCLLLFWGTLRFLRPLLPDLPRTSATTTVPEKPINGGSPTSSQTADPSLPAIPAMPAGVTRLSSGALAFHSKAADMIACYNHRWGSTYLRPLDTWSAFPGSSSPCIGAASVRYSFLSEESPHSWPAIDVYCTEGDTGILEISLSLSEHDWSETYENIFQKQTRCMLALFYPQLSEASISTLYGILRQEAKANEYISHSAVPMPKQVHVLDVVGCWGYTYSGMIRINIIPMDDVLQTDLSAKGVQIIQIAR